MTFKIIEIRKIYSFTIKTHIYTLLDFLLIANRRIENCRNADKRILQI